MRPGTGSREKLGIEELIEQEPVEQHGERDADKHRHDHVGAAEEPGNAIGSRSELAAPKVAAEVAL